MRQIFLEQAQEKDPNIIWSNKPDAFESNGVKYYIDTIDISKLTGIVWATKGQVKDLIRDIKKGDKIPLILVEKLSDGIYELHDGQHRFEAFIKLYPAADKIKAAIFQKKMAARIKIDWLKIEAKIHTCLRAARDKEMSLVETVFSIDAIMGDELKRGYVFDTIEEVPVNQK